MKKRGEIQKASRILQTWISCAIGITVVIWILGDIARAQTTSCQVGTFECAAELYLYDGKVGVGATAPVSKLQIGAQIDTFTPYVMLNNPGTNSAFRIKSGGHVLHAHISDGTEVFTIANTGKIGVGTTDPATLLQIFGTVDTSPSSHGLLVLGTTIGDNISIDSNEIMARNNGNISTLYLNQEGGHVIINGLSTANVGNVGIGTMSTVDKLHVAGNIRVGTGTTGCVKDADGTVVAGVCSSDLRLKKNIEPFSNVLDKLIHLQPVYFYWKSKEYPELGFGASRSFGLVAQEVEKVLPELVTQDTVGYKAIRYNELPFLMLQAIKELKAENETLEAENMRIKEELKDIRSEIAEIKHLFIQKVSLTRLEDK
ncbi:MAG: tail fiber domain-containing protein [Candidatus Manganitrophus sp. SB1]|nr:tail fiber domain-containing protein [Candidatus Manganitrophus morganii]